MELIEPTLSQWYGWGGLSEGLIISVSVGLFDKGLITSGSAQCGTCVAG